MNFGDFVDWICGRDKLSPGEAGRQLLTACRDGNAGEVDRLIDRGADIEFGMPKWNPLMIASYAGHAEIVGYLLSKGAKVDAMDERGWTSLLYVSQINRPKILEILLDAGAKIDAVNGEGLTSLMIASRAGDLESVRLLLDRGAKVDAIGGCFPHSASALVFALRGRHREVSDLIKERDKRWTRQEIDP